MADNAPDLTVNKVVAGAGAAATSAVIGSLFGATGTVVGAALGSVLSTVAATLYQRSLDRTRDRLVARVRPGDPSDAATVPVMNPAWIGDPATVSLRAEPVVPRGPRRSGRVYVLAALLSFVMALLAVTGVELVKGSTLFAGDSGTSVGKVVNGGGQQPGLVVAPDSTTTPDPTSDPTTSPTRTPNPDSDSAGATTSAPEDGPADGQRSRLSPSPTPSTASAPTSAPASTRDR